MSARAASCGTRAPCPNIGKARGASIARRMKHAWHARCFGHRALPCRVLPIARLSARERRYALRYRTPGGIGGAQGLHSHESAEATSTSRSVTYAVGLALMASSCVRRRPPQVRCSAPEPQRSASATGARYGQTTKALLAFRPHRPIGLADNVDVAEVPTQHLAPPAESDR
jgi:hypothetical protein